MARVSKKFKPGDIVIWSYPHGIHSGYARRNFYLPSILPVQGSPYKIVEDCSSTYGTGIGEAYFLEDPLHVGDRKYDFAPWAECLDLFMYGNALKYAEQKTVEVKHGCTCGAFKTFGAKEGSPLHTMPGRGLEGCNWAPKDNLKHG